MANLKVGKPDVAPDAPAHVPGIKRETRGQLREAGAATCRTGVDRRALDRHQPRGARADRPADAEPLAGVGAGGRRRHRRGRRPTSTSPSRALRRVRVRGRPDARLRRSRSTPSGAAVRSVMLDVQVQIAARRRRYGEASRRGSPTCSAAAPLGRRRCARPVAARDARSCPAFAGRRWSSSTCPAPTTSRSPLRATWRRCGTARCRSSCCSAAPSSTPARAAGCRRR